MGDGDVLEGARRSTLAELAEWTAWGDKVLVF
jgi:sulfur relay (sulfurtransferase) complex TusBCD TusD component (DsrE family)